VGRLVEEEIRAKLEVGRPDDRYEREADRVAAQVVRASASGPAARPDVDGSTPKVRHRGPTGRIQRQGCRRPSQSAGYERASKKTGEAFLETELGKKLTEPAEELGEALRSPGRPLDDGTRRTMEAGFGYDFSAVRIHADDRAASSARAVGARAYAVGSDVVFGAGEYRPRTRAGRRLLAHELAHVVQASQPGEERTVRRQEAEGRNTPGTGGRGPSVSLLGSESTLRIDFDAEIRRLLAAARDSSDTAPAGSPLPSEGRASGGSARRGLPPEVTDRLGLENLRTVHYGGVNPNLVGSAIRSGSGTFWNRRWAGLCATLPVRNETLPIPSSVSVLFRRSSWLRTFANGSSRENDLYSSVYSRRTASVVST
jgi:hypothetical protein